MKPPHERTLPAPRFTPSPFQLWKLSGGDQRRYERLMVKYGHIVPASLVLMEAPHLDGRRPPRHQAAERRRLRPRARPFTRAELRGARCCVRGCRRAARFQWYTCNEGKHRAVCRRCDDMLNASVLRYFGVSGARIASLRARRPR